MKFRWTVVATLAFSHLIGGSALTPLPTTANLLIHQRPPAVTTESPQLAQQSIPAPDSLGQELLQELVQCITGTVSSQQPSMEAIEAASMQCVFKVVLLDSDGKVRPDADQRLKQLVRLTGISLPRPSAQGQATVKLQPLSNSQVFTVPVIIGGKSQQFLLDTGASNSMVESQIAQQLGLTGTPIPSDLLAYMVVGDSCSEVKAVLHELPPIGVDAAQVQGMRGVGLPQPSLPGNVAGVLGLDFLSGFDVVLNPKTLQLKLLPPSTLSPDAIPLQGKLGVMTAQVKINGQGPFTFLVDTGADRVVVSTRLAQQLSLKATSAEPIQVRGFCGTTSSQPTKLTQLSLQQHQATNLDAVILKGGVLDLLQIDGIVGQNFLNRYQQHWRFGQSNELGFPENASLTLSPL